MTSEKVKSSEKVVSESTRKAVGYFILRIFTASSKSSSSFRKNKRPKIHIFSELVNRF